LSGLLKSKKGIKIVYRPAPLKFTHMREGEREDRFQRKFTVLLDETASKVIMIHSETKGATPDIHPEASPDQAAADLLKIHEEYKSFPDKSAKVAFLDALDQVRLRGVGYPFIAREIDAIYVMDSRLGQGAKPVWVITLRGLPPIPSKANEPAWQRNYFRNVVDAETGEWLYADNRPLPSAAEK
jgi:hypothetical protein